MNDLVRNLFHELADRSRIERETVFAERRIAPELRAEVESLLSFDSSTGRCITDCVSATAEELLHSGDGREFSHCGPYRLVRLLGSGGMGAVYLAERSDGEIQQKVAVKLLRAGADGIAWRDRFLNERQLLANLNHPSIAHVIDAGHAGAGQPYLVMEYVDGVPIDIYAATIDLRDKLTLFLRVCDGVSHAHHHLIIHRDLKPSNILVDVSGQPKLLDFGIAKLLNETADPTQTIERRLTPNYASPEQLRGANQTTATDVYSLGAVLYKLLTGRSPHESDTHTSQAMQVMEGTKQIPAPSRLSPSLPADIDFILRKALRAEPEERYASVEAFANDIRAFLESRPVEARSGNAWYHARKFLRRYWLPVAATFFAIAGLSAGLWLANRERAIAQRRFGQLRQLSGKVFDLDKAIRNLPGSTEARHRLVSASLEYLEGLSSDAYRDLDLAQEVGDGYWRVARVQGVPNELNLGESAKAEASLKKADALIETVLVSRPQNRSALHSSAIIANDRMILAQSEHRRADALAYARKSAERLDALLQGDVQDSDRDGVAALYHNIALAYVNMHLYEAAIPYARRTMEIARPTPSLRYRVSTGLSLLANALRYQGDLEGALQAIREARKTAEEARYSSETTRMIDMYGVLLREGLILGERGGVNLDRSKEAIEPLQKAFDMTEDAARIDPIDSTSRSRVGTSGVALGNILRHWDPGRALAVYDLAIRRLGEIRNSLAARRQRALALANSSYALLHLHRAFEGKQRIDAALAILKDTKDYPADRIPLDSEVYIALSALADFHAEEGDVRRAMEIYELLLDKVMAAKPEAFNDLRDAPRLSRVYEALADLYRRAGRSEQASAVCAFRLELWRHWDRKLPNNAFVRRQLEAVSLP